jgi:dienelactone hydrolase
MRKSYILPVFLFFALSVRAVTHYPIGHQSLTYIDSSRSNRSVATECYYPATSAGETTPIASGQFPVIAFGHGFAMTYDAYLYFADTMATLGYIVILPTTEGSMTSPSHTNFGLDLAFLVKKMKMEGGTPTSFFYNHISSKSAVMGHSMGGGSSFLGCQNNTLPTCMVTFAAATTNPSSITAAKQVTIPALVISGSADCVAAPSTDQIPMYDSLASNCKVFLSITGGGHCYFGDNNTICNMGELTCSHPLTRAAQHDVVLDFVELYLDFYLKNNSASWNIFNDSLAASPRITWQESCITTITEESHADHDCTVWPNPSTDNILIRFNSHGNYSVSVFDMLGKQLIAEEQGISAGSTDQTIDISSLQKGMYVIRLNINGDFIFKKILKD